MREGKYFSKIKNSGQGWVRAKEHPDADKNGIVQKPNIRVVDEMVNLIDASRAYEANVTAMNTTKQIAAKTLEIGRSAWSIFWI